MGGICGKPADEDEHYENPAPRKENGIPQDRYTKSSKSQQQDNYRQQDSLRRASNEQPGSINVDFDHQSHLADDRNAPSQHARPSLPSQGSMGPTGVYIPASDFKTPELCRVMIEKYDMPEAEVMTALDFAESEEYVDVYCFTYCITGGPMDPVAFKVAGLQGMDKEAILQTATAAGNDLRALNAEEQKRHDKAKRDFRVQQALQPEEEDENDPEDLEELSEAYRVKYEKDTEDMTLEQVLTYFGIPQASKTAIHRHLHPARGAVNATVVDSARRKAAHQVALERFDELEGEA